MADIRINALATTAASTASDDFVAVDGSANGTRKLNAYSPTFGGNLTVSGGTLAVTPSANDATATLKGRATGTNQLATSSRGSNVTLVNLDTTDNNCEAIAFQNSNELAIASIVAQNVSHTGRTGKLYVNISNGAAPAEALNIAADKTVTLAGNLTVSGGTATISKSSTTTGPVLQLENTNDAIDAGGTLGRLQFYSGDDSGGGNSVRAWIDSIQTTTTPVGSALRFAVANGANAVGEVVRIGETGNVLLKSDGVDSGNGKLQLAAGAADKTSGIGLGTDISIYRRAQGVAVIDAVGLAASEFNLRENGTTRFFIATAATTGTTMGAVAGSLVLKSADTTALTLDSSQNATFAGDLILGTSGPSVKSTLSARAPRQGLVFDGSSSPTVSVAGPGTGDFTVAAWVYPTTTSGAARIVGTSTYTDLNILATSYRLMFFNGVSNYVGPQCTSGKWQLVVARRTGGFLYLSVNAGTESSFADSTNIGNYTRIGSDNDGNNRTTGALVPLIYNRALSASEVVALYEAGAPAGADFQSSTTPAGVNLLTAAQATFTADTYWSKTNVTVDTGAGTATLNATVGGASLAKANSMVVGKRYRVTMEVSSANTTYYVLGNGTLATFTGTGTKTAEFVADSVTLTGCYLNSGTGTVVLDSLQVTPVGLLLAPDAAQAGGGLVWYDTSGNAANITLPASGVTWNVPSSLKLGGNWTAAGNLNASGGFYVSGSAVSPNNTACVDLSFQTTYGKVSAINRGVGNFPLALNPEGGSVLVNTTTNSGNGAVQLATHTTSAGGIGFGTDVALFHRATGVGLTLSSIGSTTPYFTLDANGTNVLDIFGLSSDVYFDQRVAGKSLFFRTNGATLALTLDSSQNATFAGAITSSRPYQDISSGLSNIYVYSTDTAAQDKGGTIQLGGAYTGTTTTTFGGVRGSKESTTAGETGGQLEFFTRPNGGAMTRRAYIGSTGNATFAGTVTPTGGIVGVTTNSNAAAGIVGEFVSSAVVSASAVSLTNATAANITSISLTAGDWDVTGLVQYNFTGATCSYVYHGFSTASAAFGAPNSYVQDYRNYTTASVSTHNPSLTFRISLAATTTIYFVTQADFSAGTVAAYGRIQARRVR